MTTMHEAKSALKLERKLVARAVAILAGPPYWKGIFREECSRLTINDDCTATLTWWEADGEYSLETQECKFIADLLFLDAKEFTDWKVQQRAIYEKERLRQIAAEKETEENKQRKLYEKLKAKFEGERK